ncbi:MAG: alpha/beta fold hydrolase [Bacteroidales bacterium]|nr:alpha/beta fold hydrolase [Bacteroidales bacterium]
MKKAISFIFIQFLFMSLLAQSQADTSIKAYNAVLKTPTGDIHGSITVPIAKERVPIVIIIPGSGNTDRDGNSIMSDVRTNTYRILALHLAKNGIATLRFDKRGVGKSQTGSMQTSSPAIDDYITDVMAWIAYLRQVDDFSDLIVLGHGEGALIGMIAAGRAKASSFISLEGVGKPVDQIYRDVLRNFPPGLIKQSNVIIDSLRAGYRVKGVSRELAGLFAPEVQLYLMSSMRYNPASEIAALKMPVLIVHGKKDKQIPPEHASLLTIAKPSAKLVLIDNMNYVLKDEADDPKEAYKTFTNPDIPCNQEMLDAVVNFIQQ